MCNKTNYNNTENILTERLVLRPVNLDDTASIFENFTEEVTRFMMPAPAKNIDEEIKIVQGFINNMAKGKECVYVITRDDEFLGVVGIHNLDKSTPKFGIWTKISAHSHGYGREAVRGVYNTYCTRFTRFKYCVDERNISSRKIAEGLGGVTSGKVKILKGSGGNDLHIIKYEIAGKQ